MNVTIKKAPSKGIVDIPSSKSLCHRAIIAASLACGVSKISNITFSKDIEATIMAMSACGAKMERDGNTLIITGSMVRRVYDQIDCNESGSTIRFMIPIALVCDAPITFTGKNNLVNRPLDPFFEIFDNQNIEYERKDAYLPLKVNSGLKSGIFKIRGDISSQFITGLLFALPLLKGDSKIIITTNLESKGYIDLTLDVLKTFGIDIINNDYKEFIIKGNQEYMPHDYNVEGDFSQAAFFLVANCLGANFNLRMMDMNSHQGDKKILKDLEDFGANITYKDSILSCNANELKGATIDFSQSPDLGPALTVLAALSNGRSDFINASRLRIKECDRITCMKNELEKLGANIEELPDGMIIYGVNSLHGGIVDSCNDHRVAMAIAMASLKCDGEIKILNASCVSKSFPHFWKVFESLGGVLEYEE